MSRNKASLWDVPIHRTKALEWNSMRSVLSVVLDNRLCEPANPPSQCQIRHRCRWRNCLIFRLRCRQPASQILWPAARSREAAKGGGANRDRTDDLKLAKLALSQLS